MSRGCDIKPNKMPLLSISFSTFRRGAELNPDQKAAATGLGKEAVAAAAKRTGRPQRQWQKGTMGNALALRQALLAPGRKERQGPLWTMRHATTPLIGP